MPKRIVLTLILLISLPCTLGIVYSFGTLGLDNAWVNTGTSSSIVEGPPSILDITMVHLPLSGTRMILPLPNIHQEYTTLPFLTDASIYRFVSRDRPLSERNYEPDDLESISGAHINTAGR